jgi:hypothetical protein
MQTGRDCARRAIEFKGPDRVPVCLSFDDKHELDREFGRIANARFEGDILIAEHADPLFRPGPGEPDQWGCVWSSMGHTMGEVVGHPLEDWDAFDGWAERLPDFREPRRYDAVRRLRAEHPDKFLIGGLGMMMESIINFRGFDNFMTDLYLERENLDRLIDLMYRKAADAIDLYAEAGLDAVMAWEDWGLQDRLMMRPSLWREIFKDRMALMIRRIHDRGMKYVLHSCGHIVDLFDDFAEIGVDVLQLDQQRNMGLETLRDRLQKRTCLWCPADIQFTSGNHDLPAVEDYCAEMLRALAAPEGGFMYKPYPQPEAIAMPLVTLLAEIRFFKSARYPAEK